MRAAPAVEVALATGRGERMLITLLHGLAGAMLARWAIESQPAAASCAALHWPWVCGAALALALPGALLARRALAPEPARLGWDGSRWLLRARAEQPLRRLDLALDLGPWVLLKALPSDGGPARWRVASQRSAGGGWHALRVALQAHAGAAPAAAGPRDAAP